MGDLLLVVRQQGLPASLITVTPLLAGTFPAPVFDVDAGLLGALRVEADLDLGGVGFIAAEVPEIGQPGGGLPHGDLAPLVFGPVGGAFVDPAARTRCGPAATRRPGPRSRSGTHARPGRPRRRRCAAGWSWLGVLRVEAEAAGGAAPDLLQVGLDRAQAFLLQVVDAAGALRVFGHQARLFEQAQVTGDRGAADRQRRGDLGHRLVPLAEQAQDVAPVRVAERLERVGLRPFGNHQATVTHRLPIWLVRGRGEQAAVERLGDGGGAVADAQLGVDVEQVGLDRGLGDEQADGGLAVAFAGRDQLEDLELALAERSGTRGADPA